MNSSEGLLENLQQKSDGSVREKILKKKNQRKLANVLELQKEKPTFVVIPFHFVKVFINVDYTLKANYFEKSRVSS